MASKECAAEERVIEGIRQGCWLVLRGGQWRFQCQAGPILRGRGVHGATVTRLLRKGWLRLSSDMNEAHVTVWALEQWGALEGSSERARV